MRIKESLLVLTIFILHQSGFSQSQVLMVAQPVTLKKGISFDLRVPADYHVSIAVEGLERPRFFCKSPDGRIFITDMHDRSDNKKGRILILENWNSKEKKFGKVTVFTDSLHNPNQIAFYNTGTNYYLYVAETEKLSYYLYKPGDTRPSSVPTAIATFPDYGLSYKYGGWHLTRSISFHNNKLYVTVGSSCNACIEKEEIRATVIEMDPDGRNQRYYARGLRNGVGLKWINNQLWVTNMGRDGIGPDKPEDLFHTIQFNGYYGWPYYVQYNKKILADVNFKDSTKP